MLIKFQFSSFKVLFSTIVVLSLIPALIIIIWTGVEHGSSLENSVREEAFRQVETLAMVQKVTSRSVYQTLMTLSILPSFTDGDYETQAMVISDLLKQNPEYVNISTVDAEGKVRSSASPALAVGTDLSPRRHIREALAGRGFVAGEFIIAYVGQEESFPFALTLRNRDGKIIGALTAVYRLSVYQTIFGRLNLPDETILGITDHHGIRIFFHPEKATNPLGKPIQHMLWENVLKREDSGTLISTGSDGIRRFYAYRKIRLSEEKEPYLYIILGIPEINATQPSRQVLYRNLILIAGVAFLSIGISSFLGHITLGKKMKSLSRTVKYIREGDLSARTGIVDSKTEVGQVAGAIDTMAARLEERDMQRDKAERILSESLTERETLLKEIHHRVKNNMQLILSLLHLEQQNSSSIEQFALQLENRIMAMSTVHEMMYQSETIAEINIVDFLERLGSVTRNLYSGLLIEIQAEQMVLNLEEAVPLALILNELLTNCVKYGKSPDGMARVTVSMNSDAGFATLTVRDRGPGFSETLEQENPTNLGMLLIKTLSKQLHGDIAFSSSGGTIAQLNFPLQRH